MRKKRFLTALLASSALASPVLAADMTPLLKAPARATVTPISGYLEMEGGFAWQDNRNGNLLSPDFSGDSGYSGTNNKWLFNGASRVNWWVGPNLSTQFDVWGGVDSFGRGSSSGGSGANNGVIANANLGGHFSYRVPEQYLVGIFGALGGIGSNANCCVGGAAFTHGTLGLEGQWYWPMLTLYGQGGVQTNLSNGDDGGSYNAWFVRVVGRYFLNENLRLEATAFYTQGWADSEDFRPAFSNGGPFGPPGGLFGDNMKMQQFAWGVGVEKKFEASPFALFARYAGAWTKFSNSFDNGYTFSDTGETIEHAFKVGFRLYLNENTLKYNDRMGTTLDIVDPMTSAYRSFGRTWNLSSGAVERSDIRLKRDIVELVRLDNGLKLYRYRYLWSDQVYVGVMAQEVAEIMPDAVLLGSDGYLRVNYARLGLRLMTWEEWEAAMSVCTRLAA
jgi:hypothetical protein